MRKFLVFSIGVLILLLSHSNVSYPLLLESKNSPMPAGSFNSILYLNSDSSENIEELLSLDREGIEQYIGSENFINDSRYLSKETVASLFTTESWIGENSQIPAASDKGTLYNCILETGKVEKAIGKTAGAGIHINLPKDVKERIPEFTALSFDMYIESLKFVDNIVIEIRDTENVINKFKFSVTGQKNKKWRTFKVPINFNASDVKNLSLVVKIEGEFPEEKQKGTVLIDDIFLDTSSEFSYESQISESSSYFGYGPYTGWVKQLANEDLSEYEIGNALYYLGEASKNPDKVLRTNIVKVLENLLKEEGKKEYEVIEALGKVVPTLYDEELKVHVARILEPLLEDDDLKDSTIEALGKIAPTLQDEKLKEHFAKKIITRSSKFLLFRLSPGNLTIEGIYEDAFYACRNIIPSLKNEELKIELIRRIIHSSVINNEDVDIREEAVKTLNFLIPVVNDIDPKYERQASDLKKDIANAVINRINNLKDTWSDKEIVENSIETLKGIVPTVDGDQQSKIISRISEILAGRRSYSYKYTKGLTVELMKDIFTDLKSYQLKRQAVDVLVEAIKENDADNYSLTRELEEALKEDIPYLAKQDQKDIFLSLSDFVANREKSASPEIANERIVRIIGDLAPKLEEDEVKFKIAQNIIKVANKFGNDSSLKAEVIKAIGYTIIPSIDSEKRKKTLADFIVKQMDKENVLKTSIETLASAITHLEDRSVKEHFTNKIYAFINSDSISIRRAAVWSLINVLITEVGKDFRSEIIDSITNFITLEDIDRKFLACDVIKTLIGNSDNEEMQIKLVQKLLSGFKDESSKVRKKVCKTFNEVFPLLNSEQKSLITKKMLSFLNNEKKEVRYNAIFEIAKTILRNVKSKSLNKKIVTSAVKFFSSSDPSIMYSYTVRDAVDNLSSAFSKLSPTMKSFFIDKLIEKLREGKNPNIEYVYFQVLSDNFDEVPNDYKTTVVDGFVEVLYTQDEDIKEDTVEFLGYIFSEISDKKKIKVVKNLLNAVDIQEKYITEEIIKQLVENYENIPEEKRSKVLNGFINILREGGSYSRQDSIWGLNEIFPNISEDEKQVVIDEVIKVLGDRQKYVIDDAEKFLRENWSIMTEDQTSIVINEFVEMLKSFNSEIREIGLEKIGINFKHFPYEKKLTVIDEVTNVLEDVKSSVRKIALSIIGKNFELIPEVKKSLIIDEILIMLGDAESDIREEAVDVLNDNFDRIPKDKKPLVIDRVIVSLNDTDKGVRSEAISFFDDEFFHISDSKKVDAINIILNLLRKSPTYSVRDFFSNAEIFKILAGNKRVEILKEFANIILEYELDYFEDSVEVIEEGVSNIKEESNKITLLIDLLEVKEEVDDWWLRYEEDKKAAERLNLIIKNSILQLSNESVIELAEQVINQKSSYEASKYIREIVRILERKERQECIEELEKLIS